jgi:hypothetical protein
MDARNTKSPFESPEGDTPRKPSPAASNPPIPAAGPAVAAAKPPISPPPGSMSQASMRNRKTRTCRHYRHPQARRANFI